MRHRREEVMERTIREFELLDRLVAGLSAEDWKRPLLRPEGKDPWTVKDALVHITFWKADMVRAIRKQRRPPDERGLKTNDHNHLVYERWRGRSPHEVLAWHRQVQEDALAALREAPDEWFGGKDRGAPWPFDLDGHSAQHRVRDIERALAASTRD
jgi:hypothetical protein